MTEVEISYHLNSHLHFKSKEYRAHLHCVKRVFGSTPHAGVNRYPGRTDPLLALRKCLLLLI